MMIRSLLRRKALRRNTIPAPFSALSEPARADYRGIPTLACPCGCDWVLMCALFDQDTRLPGFYLLDGRCASCGSWVTLPTPLEIDQ